MSETSKTLVLKLAAVMNAVERVQKRGHNQFHGYNYATEADISATIRKELADRFVMLIPSIVGETRHSVGEKGSWLTVLEMEMEFLDGESGESIKKSWRGYGTDKEDKGGYKAITGAEKYFLLKTFLIPTGDDPERDDKAQLKERDKATVKPDKETKKARVMPEAAKADGAVFVEKVIPKSRGNQEWADVILSSGETVIAREPGCISLAVNLAQEISPVIVTTSRNGKGNVQIEEIARWRPQVDVPPAVEELAEVL